MDFRQGSESTSAFCIQRRIGPCRRVIGFRCHSATLSPAAPNVSLNCETCMAKARWNRWAESTKRDMTHFWVGRVVSTCMPFTLLKLVPFSSRTSVARRLIAPRPFNANRSDTWPIQFHHSYCPFADETFCPSSVACLGHQSPYGMHSAQFETRPWMNFTFAQRCLVGKGLQSWQILKLVTARANGRRRRH